LIINSPGGSPTQSSLIAKRIIDLAKEKIKKFLHLLKMLQLLVVIG
jgi:ClpP class serine protease